MVEDRKKMVVAEALIALLILSLFVSSIYFISFFTESPDNQVSAMAVSNISTTGSQGSGGIFSFSSLLYGLSLILNVVLIGVLVTYHSRLQSMVVTDGSADVSLDSSPRQVIMDFFSIIIKIQGKKAKPDYVSIVLNKIKDNHSKEIPSMDDISITFSHNTNEIQVAVKKDLEWVNVYSIVKTFMRQLNISEEKITLIADYEKKADLISLLRKFKAIKQ